MVPTDNSLDFAIKSLSFTPKTLGGPKKPGRQGAFPGAPQNRTKTVLARGPSYLARARKPVQVSGPGEPPPGFVTPTTSASEWPPFWALARITGVPADPREGPYFQGDVGWPYWGYQIRLDGGGAVIDFLVYPEFRGKRLGIRIVTPYFHLGLGSGKIATDQIQLANLMKYVDVYDLLDSDYMSDKTGEATIISMKRALGMLQSPDPIYFGSALPGRQT